MELCRTLDGLEERSRTVPWPCRADGCRQKSSMERAAVWSLCWFVCMLSTIWTPDLDPETQIKITTHKNDNVVSLTFLDYCFLARIVEFLSVGGKIHANWKTPRPDSSPLSDVCVFAGVSRIVLSKDMYTLFGHLLALNSICPPPLAPAFRLREVTGTSTTVLGSSPLPLLWSSRRHRCPLARSLPPSLFTTHEDFGILSFIHTLLCMHVTRKEPRPVDGRKPPAMLPSLPIALLLRLFWVFFCFFPSQTRPPSPITILKA